MALSGQSPLPPYRHQQQHTTKLGRHLAGSEGGNLTLGAAQTDAVHTEIEANQQDTEATDRKAIEKVVRMGTAGTKAVSAGIATEEDSAATGSPVAGRETGRMAVLVLPGLKEVEKEAGIVTIGGPEVRMARTAIATASTATGRGTARRGTGRTAAASGMARVVLVASMGIVNVDPSLHSAFKTLTGLGTRLDSHDSTMIARPAIANRPSRDVSREEQKTRLAP